MRVALVMGGRGGEHDVSLATGRAVAESLDRLRHDRWQLVLGREGGAAWPAGSGSVASGLAALERRQPDAVFIAMHGVDGEDGRLQGALELLRIPYQGAGVAASAGGLDKTWSRHLFHAAGLPQAPGRVVASRAVEGIDWDGLARELGLPLVLKQAHSGSSVGVEVVDDAEALPERARVLSAGGVNLVVEGWLAGDEVTCPVMEGPDGTPEALPLIGIHPRRTSFFDYETKYDPDAVDEICPAPIEEGLAEEIRRLGLAAHRALGCRHYSRSDFRLDAEGRPHLLELNTLPGLTPASLVPKAASEAGLGFDGLVQRLLDRAVADAGRPSPSPR